MSYRLPDPPADTPRTNAEEYASDTDCYGQICGLVGSRFARKLERELNTSEAQLTEVRTKLTRLFALADIVEESDSGNLFHPNRLGGSCRALDGAEMNQLLGELKTFTIS